MTKYSHMSVGTILIRSTKDTKKKPLKLPEAVRGQEGFSFKTLDRAINSPPDGLILI